MPIEIFLTESYVLLLVRIVSSRRFYQVVKYRIWWRNKKVDLESIEVHFMHLICGSATYNIFIPSFPHASHKTLVWFIGPVIFNKTTSVTTSNRHQSPYMDRHNEPSPIKTPPFYAVWTKLNSLQWGLQYFWHVFSANGHIKQLFTESGHPIWKGK